MNIFEYPDGATPLDPDEIDGLKRRHITTREELNRWEQENIQDAIAWLQSRRKSDILREDFICRLHEKMFGKVWKWAGSFRRTDKNIGVQWTMVPVELKQLLDDTSYWIVNKTYPPGEIACRFHHKLVWIHLFPNGNGRHARMMADLLLEEVFKAAPFTWGGGNLADAGETRRLYIQALQAADQHDYSPLKRFLNV